MTRRIVQLAGFALILSATLGTGAFASGDQAVGGVYLNPADSQNGDAYAEIGPNGQLRIELTNLNPEATTVVDDLFTISTTNNRSRVWIEHDAGAAVTFYRSDTDETIGGRDDRMLLEDGETVPVGLRIDAESETVILTRITVHAEIEPTATTAPPTTVPAGPGPSTPTDTPEPTSVPTEPSGTTTAAPTTAAPGTTTAPTATGSGSTTTSGADSTDALSTATGTTPPPETTTVPATTTTPPTTSPGTTSSPTAAGTPDGEPSTEDPTPTDTPAPPTDSTTVPDGTPTATSAPPVTTAPAQTERSPTSGNVTVSTPTDDTEIGGLSPAQLGGAVAALAALALALFAWGLLGSSSVLVLVADAGDGLSVAPRGLTDEWYDLRDDGFEFRFAESDPWLEATGDDPVSFDRAVTVTNTGTDAARVSVADADVLGDLAISTEGVDLATDGFVLESGESGDLTLELPSDYDPDGEVTVRFRRSPLDR
ncbi:MAG: hypothetical protein ABEJ26_07305 [Halosimplex sp.]